MDRIGGNSEVLGESSEQILRLDSRGEEKDANVYFLPVLLTNLPIFCCNISEEHHITLVQHLMFGAVEQLELTCEECKYTRFLLVERHRAYMVIRYGTVKVPFKENIRFYLS